MTTRTRSLLAPVLMGLLALIFYTLTLYRTVPGGDSGELITVAHVWGVAHPPGYPLYTMIAHLFELLPFQSVAWRVGLLSAVCDALATGFLTAAVISFGETSFFLWAGVFAGGLFAFSPEIWRYATQAEVFPLNNLFVSALLFLSVRYNQTKNDRTLYLAALVAGLGSFHQQTFIFVAVPFGIWVLKGLSKKKFFVCSILFILGGLPYLYLPVSDSLHAAMSWGEPGTIRGFLIHFLRREYGTFQLGPSFWKSTTSHTGHLWSYLRSLPAEFLGGLFILALPGIYISYRRQWWIILSFLSYLFVFSWLSNSMLDVPLHQAIEARFWQQPDVFVCFWCGLGFAWLFGTVASRTNPILVAATALALVIAQNAVHFQQSDQSKNHVVEDYARSILANLESNSILIVTSDVAWNATQYLQLCEDFRPDVRVISQEMMTYVWMTEKMKSRYPDLTFPGSYYLSDKDSRSTFITRYDGRYASGGYSMLEFLNANSHRPIYLSYLFKEPSVLSQYELIPVGLYDRVVSLKSPDGFDRTLLNSQATAFWAHFNSDSAVHAREDTWEHFIEQLIELYRVRHSLSSQVIGAHN